MFTRLNFNSSHTTNLIHKLPLNEIKMVFRELEFDHGEKTDNKLFALLQLRTCQRTQLIQNLNSRDVVPFEFLRRHNVNSNDRGRLIDWMIEVTTSYSQNPSTFFLAINIIDSFYQSSKSLLQHQNDLHIIGVTAMFIASKLLGIVPLSIENMISICHDSFRRDQIIQSEKTILFQLGFQIDLPTVYTFVVAYIQELRQPKDDQDRKCQRIAVMVMFDYELITCFKKKAIAASILYLINKELLPKLSILSQTKELKIKQLSTKIKTLRENFSSLYPNFQRIKMYQDVENKENKMENE